MPNQQPHHAGEITAKYHSLWWRCRERWALMPLKSRMDALFICFRITQRSAAWRLYATSALVTCYVFFGGEILTALSTTTLAICATGRLSSAAIFTRAVWVSSVKTIVMGCFLFMVSSQFQKKHIIGRREHLPNSGLLPLAGNFFPKLHRFPNLKTAFGDAYPEHFPGSGAEFYGMMQTIPLFFAGCDAATPSSRSFLASSVWKVRLLRMSLYLQFVRFPIASSFARYSCANRSWRESSFWGSRLFRIMVAFISFLPSFDSNIQHYNIMSSIIFNYFRFIFRWGFLAHNAKGQRQALFACPLE